MVACGEETETPVGQSTSDAIGGDGVTVTDDTSGGADGVTKADGSAPATDVSDAGPGGDCTSDADCAQLAGSCESAVCSDGACVVNALPAGEACDDGDACTTGEQCQDGGGCGAEKPWCVTMRTAARRTEASTAARAKLPTKVQQRPRRGRKGSVTKN